MGKIELSYSSPSSARISKAQGTESFIDQLGPDAEYVLSREVWALDIGEKKPLVNTINDLFKRRFGRNMNGNSARAFTGFMVLADAVNRSLSLSPSGIRKALRETDVKEDHLIMPWSGVQFDSKTGQNIKGRGIIVQIQNGEYKTVWPRDLSATSIIWPMPTWSQRNAVIKK